MIFTLVAAAASTAVVSGFCPRFCGTDAEGKAHTFDLSTLPNKTFTLNDNQLVTPDSQAKMFSDSLFDSASLLSLALAMAKMICMVGSLFVACALGHIMER